MQYNRLGYKTFWLLVLKRSHFFFLIAFFSVIFYVSLQFIPTDYLPLTSWAALILGCLLALAFVWMLFVGWLEYLRYRIVLEGDSIKVTRGVLVENEIGVPFRRIKQVSLQRNLINQMLGISDLILIILGEDESNPASAESKIILPALDNKIATQIQDVLLRNSAVEEVKEVSSK